MNIFFMKLGRFLCHFHVIYEWTIKKRFRIAIGFDFRDIWIGLYWDKVPEKSSNPLRWSFYFMILTFGIRIRSFV